ncbi:T9SS type A sorting domain-containing protein [Rubrivirga marina]|uniref:Secretion system C-terminal sorting domain-containing protein n=1 Tax=Rubrivirga marina TaxID=1196024 RepID=A0A271J3F2_9BACT|nr:T9SS type A sorting domain-containing protein [Rubrivirga marina]PAP77485.1 hypothetical protein BSZ37_14080 [Rubrivirga marina]
MRHIALLLVLLAVPALPQADVAVSGTVVLDGSRVVVTGDLVVESGGTLDAASGGLTFGGAAVSQQFFDRDGDGQLFVVQDLAFDNPGGDVLVYVVPRIMGVLGLYAGSYAFEEGPATLAAKVSGGEVVRLGAIDGAGAERSGDAIVYERPYVDGEGWRMIASPFAGVPFASLNDDFHTQGAAGADYEDGDPILYAWDPGAPPDARYEPVSDYTKVFPAGVGFFFFAFDTEADGETPILPGVWDVEGEENVSAGVPIRYEAEESLASFNLLGNPFAAPLDWRAVQAAGAFQTTYAVWDPAANGGAGNYAYYSLAGTATGRAGRYIPAFQAFWAEATDASPGELAFDRSWKAVGESPVFVGRRAPTAELRLHVEGEGLEATDPIAVFLDGGAEGADRYDAAWLVPLSPDHVAARFVRADGAPLVFEGRPADADGQTLALDVAATRTGTYTISWPDLDAAPSTPLALVDRETGQTIDLRASDSYTFTLTGTGAAGRRRTALPALPATTAALASEPRFVVRFGASVEAEAGAPTANDLVLRPPAPNPARELVRLAYQTGRSGPVRLDVVDVLGRLVAVIEDAERPAGDHAASFDASRVPAGVYVLRLQAAGVTRTRAITLVR